MSRIDIRPPYLLFLGDASDQPAAKVAFGIATWRPELCTGQLRLAGCLADTGLADITIAKAREKGCRTLIIGVANRGGVIPDSWRNTLLEAIQHNLDIASGSHELLADIASLQSAAEQHGVRLWDVRHPRVKLEVGKGAHRAGKRLLTVGTDCSVGKMFTALAIEREMRKRGKPVAFRATGQTGILIAGTGIAVDAVISDFISGAVEWLSPANDPGHWDIIEGQGSLFHPSFAGVSLGLLHGACPDALVMCHDPARPHMRGVPDYPLPDLREAIELNTQMAQRVNPDCRIIGVSVNTSGLEGRKWRQCLEDIERTCMLPAVDITRRETHGVASLVDAIFENEGTVP